ncbi:hypothetical protein [Terriglobus albidus]|uniref:hypothetical protein n=1 Tax=Terriglobus albidus TaxID=1592106 RepID=UPI0021E04829|nr:hypothetical protein [Terriglobus albidus]
MLLLALVWQINGCRSTGNGTGIVEQYLKLAVSLGERDPDFLDFYTGPEPLALAARTPLPSLEKIEQDRKRLQAQLLDSGLDAGRVTFLGQQLNAMNQRVRQLRGVTAGFNEESRNYFGVVAPPDTDAAQRAKVRTEISTLIGPGAKAYSSYEAMFVVPAKHIPAVFETALKVCREQTRAHISMPAGEQVDVVYVINKPWAAFSRYLGNAHSQIQVNLEFPQTVDRLLDLACHEGYPGHHVFNTLREEALVKQRRQLEWTAQPAFSPQSFVSEAAASYAPRMVLEDATRMQIEHDVLFPIVGLPQRDIERYLRVEKLIAMLHTGEPEIAREYLDGRLEFARALSRLEEELLMEHGETMLTYLNEYRSYMLTYTVGLDRVTKYVNAGGPQNRWQRYTELMTTPMTNLPE